MKISNSQLPQLGQTGVDAFGNKRIPTRAKLGSFLTVMAAGLHLALISGLSCNAYSAPWQVYITEGIESSQEFTVQAGDAGSLRVNTYISDYVPEVGEDDGDLDETYPNEEYVLWQVIPESSARIEYQSSDGLDISFTLLEPGTVSFIATAYGDDAFYQATGREPESIQFDFTVLARENDDFDSNDDDDECGSDTDGEALEDLSTLDLSARQRNTFNSLLQACDSANENQGDAAFDNLQATCSNPVLQDDLTRVLERLSAEEYFGVADALLNTAYIPLNHIESRLLAVRSGQRQSIDMRNLTLQLYDQQISGSVLSKGLAALTQYSGGASGSDTSDDALVVGSGNASDDAIDNVPHSASRKSAFRDSALGVFANGNLSVGNIDGNNIQQDATFSTNSITFGADLRIADDKVVGAALSLTNDDTEFAAEGGELVMQSVDLSAFATWYRTDKGYADFIVSFSQGDFSTSRRIDMPGQVIESANSTTHSRRFVASFNIGRTFQHSAMEFGPFLSIDVMHASVDGFRESSSLPSGSAGTTLDVDGFDVTSTRFSLGGELQRAISTSKAVLVPSIKLAIEIENETEKEIITASFVDAPDTNKLEFTGADRDRSSLQLSIGTTAVLPHGQSAFMFLDSRLLDNRVNQNNIRLGYRLHF